MLSAAIIKGAFHFDLIADIIESRYAKGKQTQNLTLIEKPFCPNICIITENCFVTLWMLA